MQLYHIARCPVVTITRDLACDYNQSVTYTAIYDAGKMEVRSSERADDLKLTLSRTTKQREHLPAVVIRVVHCNLTVAQISYKNLAHGLATYADPTHRTFNNEAMLPHVQIVLVGCVYVHTTNTHAGGGGEAERRQAAGDRRAGGQGVGVRGEGAGRREEGGGRRETKLPFATHPAPFTTFRTQRNALPNHRTVRSQGQDSHSVHYAKQSTLTLPVLYLRIVTWVGK